MFLIVFGLFWFDVHDPQPGILQQWENGKVEVTGKVLSLGTRDNQYILQLTTVNGHNLSLKPRVVVNTSWEDNQIYGWNDLVKFTGILEEPLPQTNPGVFRQKSSGGKRVFIMNLMFWEKEYSWKKEKE